MESIHIIVGIMIMMSIGLKDRYRLVALNKTFEVKRKRIYIVDPKFCFSIEENMENKAYNTVKPAQKEQCAVCLMLGPPAIIRSGIAQKICLNNTKHQTVIYGQYQIDIMEVDCYSCIKNEITKADMSIKIKIFEHNR